MPMATEPGDAGANADPVDRAHGVVEHHYRFDGIERHSYFAMDSFELLCRAQVHDEVVPFDDQFGHRSSTSPQTGISTPPDAAVHANQSGVGQTALVNGGTVEGSDGEPEWRDLAANRPGQEARKAALERRQAAPVKTFVARLLQVHSTERAWRVGAEGEEEVARRLGRLREGWRVLHAVPVGEKGSDIDHVVIGPSGVFTLNTKNHIRSNVWVTDTVFMVNGQKREYFRNSRHEAKRASGLLSAACGFEVLVEPIIVVLAARLTVKSQPADVHVVGRKRIRKWLTHQRPTLTPERVEQIYGYARRDLTWRPTLG